MKIENLVDAIRDILPNAEFSNDNHGQLIIYTNKIVTEDDDVINFFVDDNDDDAS